jgi:hypothetical protein
VKALDLAALKGTDKAEVLDFQKSAAELMRSIMAANAVINEANERITAIKKALFETPGANPELMSEARELEIRLMDLDEELNGDPTKPRRSEPAPPSIMRRLRTAVGETFGQTYGPTNTHIRQYEIASEQFTELLPKLRQFIEVDLVAFEEKIEGLGAPWTPGRKIPNWPK